jgi:hypothetical protein
MGSSKLNELFNFFSQHPFIATAISTWITNVGASAFVSSLPSPTKDSTQLYIFCFKFANRIIAGNFARANGSAVENSPNFQAAVDKLNTQKGTDK